MGGYYDDEYDKYIWDEEDSYDNKTITRPEDMQYFTQKYFEQANIFESMNYSRTYSCWVRGVLKIERKAQLYEFGESVKLRLERESSNPYDTNAIKVNTSYKKLGYIPKEDAIWMAPLMDKGYAVNVYLLEVHASYGDVIKIRIGLESDLFSIHKDNMRRMRSEIPYLEKVVNVKNAKGIGISDEYIYVLTDDGRVDLINCKPDEEYRRRTLEKWSDIIKLSVSYKQVAGLKSNNTIEIYESYYLSYDNRNFIKKIFDNWNSTKIKEINNICDLHIIHNDIIIVDNMGNVYSSMTNDSLQREILKWNNVIKIDGNWRFVVGIQKDGKVLFTTYKTYTEKDNELIHYLRDEISTWSDITHISVNNEGVIGLTKNGRLVTANIDYTSTPFEGERFTNVNKIILDDSNRISILMNDNNIYIYSKGKIFATDKLMTTIDVTINKEKTYLLGTNNLIYLFNDPPLYRDF